MPSVRKEDAERALRLLEQYHSKLTNPKDAALRNALERVIKIFRSRLFYALIDIQEYYQEIINDIAKSPDQITKEALVIAKKWERQPSSPADQVSDVKDSVSN